MRNIIYYTLAALMVIITSCRIPNAFTIYDYRKITDSEEIGQGKEFILKNMEFKNIQTITYKRKIETKRTKEKQVSDDNLRVKEITYHIDSVHEIVIPKNTSGICVEVSREGNYDKDFDWRKIYIDFGDGVIVPFKAIDPNHSAPDFENTNKYLKQDFFELDEKEVIYFEGEIYEFVRHPHFSSIRLKYSSYKKIKRTEKDIYKTKKSKFTPSGKTH